eukprot:UN01724
MAAEIEAGKTFYAEQLATGNYHEAEEGYLYRFITEGQTGKGQSNNSSEKPGPTDKVKVHYEGKLINGKVFDSSYKRGETISFGLNQVIKGWGLAVQKMSYGDKIECILPQELAYGMRGAGQDIPGGATLIFIIELFENTLPPAVKEGKEYYAQQKATGEWIEHPAGMLYKWIVPPKEGEPKPDENQQVEVHYEGTLINGTVFDSSYKRGETIKFPLQNVIQGWTLIVQEMTCGSKLKVIIPSTLAYGDDSDKGQHIKAGSTLIFDIELFSYEPAPPPQCNIM